MTENAISKTEQIPERSYHTIINVTEFCIRVFPAKKANDSYESLIKKRLFRDVEKRETNENSVKEIP